MKFKLLLFAMICASRPALANPPEGYELLSQESEERTAASVRHEVILESITRLTAIALRSEQGLLLPFALLQLELIQKSWTFEGMNDDQKLRLENKARDFIKFSHDLMRNTLLTSCHRLMVRHYSISLLSITFNAMLRDKSRAWYGVIFNDRGINDLTNVEVLDIGEHSRDIAENRKGFKHWELAVDRYLRANLKTYYNMSEIIVRLGETDYSIFRDQKTQELFEFLIHREYSPVNDEPEDRVLDAKPSIRAAWDLEMIAIKTELMQLGADSTHLGECVTRCAERRFDKMKGHFAAESPQEMASLSGVDMLADHFPSASVNIWAFNKSEWVPASFHLATRLLTLNSTDAGLIGSEIVPAPDSDEVCDNFVARYYRALATLSRASQQRSARYTEALHAHQLQMVSDQLEKLKVSCAASAGVGLVGAGLSGIVQPLIGSLCFDQLTSPALILISAGIAVFETAGEVAEAYHHNQTVDEIKRACDAVPLRDRGFLDAAPLKIKPFKGLLSYDEAGFLTDLYVKAVGGGSTVDEFADALAIPVDTLKQQLPILRGEELVKGPFSGLAR